MFLFEYRGDLIKGKAVSSTRGALLNTRMPASDILDLSEMPKTKVGSL